MKERGLRDYFDALGGSGGFDLEKLTATKTQPTTSKWKRIMRFGTPGRSSWTMSSPAAAGAVKGLEEDFEALMRSTTYLSWWASKPSEIVERFRAKLRKILLEGNREKLRNDAAAARARAALEALRPNEPPLGDLTADEQSWLATAFAYLSIVFMKNGRKAAQATGHLFVFSRSERHMYNFSRYGMQRNSFAKRSLKNLIQKSRRF